MYGRAAVDGMRGMGAGAAGRGGAADAWWCALGR